MTWDHMSSSGHHVRCTWKKFSKSSTLDQRWVGGVGPLKKNPHVRGGRGRRELGSYELRSELEVELGSYEFK